LCYVTKGAPQRQASLSVVKYTGTQSAPEWMDTEPGSLFSFSILCEGHSHRADKFETLCTVKADLSTAPSQYTARKKKRKACYTRDFDVILLVGHTELKAQIGWIDSATVSYQRILPRPAPFLIFVMCILRGRRKGSKHCH